MQADFLSTKQLAVAGSGVEASHLPSARWRVVLFYFVVLRPQLWTFYATPQPSMRKLASEVVKSTGMSLRVRTWLPLVCYE